MPDKVKNMDMIEDGKIVMILPAKENKEQKQHTDKNHYQKNSTMHIALNRIYSRLMTAILPFSVKRPGQQPTGFRRE